MTRPTRNDAGDEPTTEQLLDAYASGATDDDDARRVEEYLDANPDAAAELDEARDVISRVRRAQPQPAETPDWTALSRDIARACDEIEARRERGIWRRVTRWLRPQYSLPVAAFASAALVWFATRSPDVHVPGAELPDMARTATGDAPGAIDDAPAPIELRMPAVDSLDADELDALAETLTPAAFMTAANEDSGDEDDDDYGAVGLPLADPVLSPEAVADWTGEADDVAYATGAGFGLLDEPDYGALVDEMSDDDLDRLETYLDDQAG